LISDPVGDWDLHLFDDINATGHCSLRRRNLLPTLVTAADLMSVRHAPSIASDGSDTLEAMASRSATNTWHHRSLEDRPLRGRPHG